MFRILFTGNKTAFIPVVVVLAGATLLGGCGNSQVDTSSAPMPSNTNTQVMKTAAAGPAISTKLKFVQLALDSPVKSVKNKNGLVYLHFRYTDKDNNVYNCELPAAMSEGEYTADEWLATFGAYKLPQIVKHKVVKKKEKGLNDFPFISPKPKAVEQPGQTSSPTQLPGGPN